MSIMNSMIEKPEVVFSIMSSMIEKPVMVFGRKRCGHEFMINYFSVNNSQEGLKTRFQIPE